MVTRQDKRRYSDVRGCCGWSRWSSGCEPGSVARRASRRGRRWRRLPQTLAPQWATQECWAGLPEASRSRRAAVRWLAMLASRVVAARVQEAGAAGTDVADLAGERGRP